MHILEIWAPVGFIETIFATGHTKIEFTDTDSWPVNSYILLKSEVNINHKALVKYIGDGKVVIQPKLGKQSVNGIHPKDARQTVFLDCLLDPDILINVAIGSAGTGKTTISLAYALQEFILNNKKIILTKPTTMVGNSKAFGAVPGDISEKYAPYLDSYFMIMEKLSASEGKDYFKAMQNNGDLKFLPISLVRGCTFDNSVVILDEAQNLTWHEMNSFVSRMGESTKLIILGDPNQIDTSARFEDTGLAKLITAKAFERSYLTSVIELITQYRSPITELVARIDKEIRDR